MDQNFNLPNNLPMQEVLRMASTPAGQQLIALLRQQGGNEFKKAMENASSGNYAQAKQAIESLLSDSKAQQLLKELGGHHLERNG